MKLEFGKLNFTWNSNSKKVLHNYISFARYFFLKLCYLAKKASFRSFGFNFLGRWMGVFTLNYWNGRKRIQTHGKQRFDLLEIGLGALDCSRLVCVLIYNFFSVYLGFFWYIWENVECPENQKYFKRKNILCTFL